MKLGLSCYDITAADLLELGEAADVAGFDSLWLGEHVVLPLDYASAHPATGTGEQQHESRAIIDPRTILVDPLIALSAVAARTTRIRLATGIYVVPLRHPVAVARMAATLHDVAGGRLLFGAGAGWLREEFDALDAPFDSRGERFDEAIGILRAAWAGGPITGTGPHFRFGSIQIADHELDIPLILGGNTERALRRAAARADGWFSSGTPTFDDAVHLRERIRALRAEQDAVGPFPLWVRAPRAERSDLARYEAAGFEHVVVWADQLWPRPGDGEPASRRDRFAAAAAALGLDPA